MVPEKYTLAAIGRHLLGAFERRRPAIESWDTKTEESLLGDARAELAQMRKQLGEMGMDDPEYWAHADEAVRRVIIPRYVAMAREENRKAARDYGLWRGGDLIARGAFAAVGLVLGAAAVAIPWIPVSEKWIPWALFVSGPFLPDAYFWWYHRSYQKKLDRLVTELAAAGEGLEKYRPLSEMQRLMGVAEPPASIDSLASPDAQPTKTRG